jgi:hypothetical protein
MSSRRQKPVSGRVEVPDVAKMLQQTFRLHCQTRHPQMRGLRTPEHHAKDHILHDESIDHVHATETEVEDGTGTESD